MTQERGIDIVFQVNTGTEQSPTWSTIGGLREKSSTLNNESVDITSGSTSGKRKLLEGAGTQSLDMSVEGVFEDDTAYQALRAAAFANTHEHCRMLFESGDVIEGTFEISSTEFGGAYNDARTYSFSLISSGDFSYEEAAS